MLLIILVELDVIRPQDCQIQRVSVFGMEPLNTERGLNGAALDALADHPFDLRLE